MLNIRFFYIVPLLVLLFQPGCSSKHPSTGIPLKAFSDSPYKPLGDLSEGTILHIPTGIEVEKETMFRFIQNSRITYVGEAHTNIRDHEVELEVIKGMFERFPGKIAVGMEMFERGVQGELDRWTDGSLDKDSFLTLWYHNWDQDYRYYSDILDYIRENKIPLIGLNASSELIRESMIKGTDDLPEGLKSQLPEIDTSDPYHRRSLEAVYGGHTSSKEGFESFYKTMLIWDETMAQSISDYLSSPEGLGKKMIVLAGGFHVNYGYGIPRRVFRRLPEPFSIVLPFTPVIPVEHSGVVMDVEPVHIPLYLADFVWVVGYDDLSDKGVRLGVIIEKTEGGIKVIRVIEKSNAARHGIEANDVIVRFNGKLLVETFQLSHAIRELKEGEEATLEILREGKKEEISVEFRGQ